MNKPEGIKPEGDGFRLRPLGYLERGFLCSHVESPSHSAALVARHTLTWQAYPLRSNDGYRHLVCVVGESAGLQVISGNALSGIDPIEAPIIVEK
jgi:hypothetical protein